MKIIPELKKIIFGKSRKSYRAATRIFFILRLISSSKHACPAMQSSSPLVRVLTVLRTARPKRGKFKTRSVPDSISQGDCCIVGRCNSEYEYIGGCGDDSCCAGTRAEVHPAGGASWCANSNEKRSRTGACNGYSGKTWLCACDGNVVRVPVHGLSVSHLNILIIHFTRHVSRATVPGCSSRGIDCSSISTVIPTSIPIYCQTRVRTGCFPPLGRVVIARKRVPSHAPRSIIPRHP